VSIYIPTTPDVRVLGSDRFLLVGPCYYEWEAAGYPRQRLVAREGFEFDGASVPRAAHAFVGRWDLGLYPPLWHDLLYRCAGNPFRSEYLEHVRDLDGQWVPAGHLWTRSEADRLFGRQMRDAGVAKWRRRSAYFAVRTFGGRAWHD